MCDELSFADHTIASPDRGMTRREFAVAGSAAMVATYPGPAAAAGPLAESMVMVPTPDGQCDAFFVHPAKGRYPGVVLWPDALGLREVKKAMARRLASEGYAVLAVNPYYRNVRAPLDMDFAALLTPEGRAKIGPYMPALSAPAIARDGAAHVAFLNGQRAVDPRRGIGVQGYCFAGPFAFRTAAAAASRVRAVATFHGGGLVTDKPDSPHLLIPQIDVGFLLAIARNDDRRAPLEKTALGASARSADRPAEIEVYAADHGWCVPDAPSYDRGEAERAWSRLLALYRKL